MPPTQKRARVAYPCRVCSQDCLMEQESIQCDGCECWLHQQCICMSYTQYVTFSAPHLQFFCKHCIGTADQYNVASSLSRIAVHAPDLIRMREQAESELNLLQFYSVSLPHVVQVASDQVNIHKQSQHLLPWLLHQYVPADVAGDGNCLFRAVSLAMYGNESQHSLLRLLAAIEVLLHSTLYDTTSQYYYEPYRVDDCLVLGSYQSFVCDIVQHGTYV